MKTRDYLYIALVVLAVLVLWNYGPGALSATGRFLTGGWAAMTAAPAPEDVKPPTVANDAPAAPAPDTAAPEAGAATACALPTGAVLLQKGQTVTLNPNPLAGAPGAEYVDVPNKGMMVLGCNEAKTDYWPNNTWTAGGTYTYGLPREATEVWISIQGDTKVSVTWTEEATLVLKSTISNGFSAAVTIK